MTAATRGSVGIDVSKGTLEVQVRPTDAQWTVANDDAGIRALVAQLQTAAPAQIVIEATGGYELAVVSALAAAGLPVIVVNPRAVRDFARATGQLAKTRAATTLLWQEYEPQYKVWIPFAAIGVAAAVALGGFGQMAKRWRDMNA